MTTSARPLPAPAADPLPPLPTVRDLIAQRQQLRDRIEQLERNTRSLVARNRALIKARNDLTPVMYSVGTFNAAQSMERAIRAAQTCEALGVVPAVRFVRNEANDITGIELVAMTETPDVIDDGFRMLAAIGGMAVVRG